jgi:hypothetical protein
MDPLTAAPHSLEGNKRTPAWGASCIHTRERLGLDLSCCAHNGLVPVDWSVLPEYTAPKIGWSLGDWQGERLAPVHLAGGKSDARRHATLKRAQKPRRVWHARVHAGLRSSTLCVWQRKRTARKAAQKKRPTPGLPVVTKPETLNPSAQVRGEDIPARFRGGVKTAETSTAGAAGWIGQ